MSIDSYKTEPRCPICSRTVSYLDTPPGGVGLWVKCEKCGEYIIDENEFMQDFSSRYRLRSCIYYYLTQKADSTRDKNLIPQFTEINNSEDDRIFQYQNTSTYIKPISISSIMQIYPNDLNEKIAMIMLNLESEVGYIGNFIGIPFSDDGRSMSYLFFLDERHGADSISKQALGIIGYLRSGPYINEYGPGGIRGSTNYFISPNGWRLINDFQKSNRDLSQGFIAMWFAPEMVMAKNAIINAIGKSGYMALAIDMKHYNDQIVPEIFYEIGRSEFIVADLTGGRGGVYYEAGYAHGLGKQVIMCCQKEEIDDLHFDVKQKNAVVWDNETDLETKLYDRIIATIGKRS